MKIKYLLLLSIFSAGAVIFHCTKSPVANGTGSTTETAKVVAMLYNPGGSPAANATVHFYKSDDDPRTGNGDSTETDVHGNYSVKLDTGTYNIIAHGDSGLAYQDSIKVTKGDTVKPPADTLKPAGSIKGVVRLEEGGDPTTVFILFMGTRTFTFPDDTSGSFTSDSMAAGSYRVRILTTTPNYRTLDTTLRVIAGTQNVLPGPLVLQYTGIPMPTGLAISYDNLKQIVTLMWNKPTTGKPLKSYNVYRRNVDSNTTLSAINTQLVTDTVYRDSSGVQDMTYEYRVTAVDTTTTEGTRSAAASIKVVSAFTFLQTITLDSLSFYPISFTVAPDTTFYIAYNGSGGGNNSFVGVFDKTGHNTAIVGRGMFIQLYDVAVDSRKNVYAADPDGNKIIKFNSSGDSVFSWTVSQPLRICIDRNDKLFVLINNCAGIAAFDTSGTAINSISASCDIDAGNMAIGTDGTVYSRDRSGSANKAFIIDNNLSLISNPTFFPKRDLGDVRGVDNAKRIYFRDVEFMNVYDTTGNRLASWMPGIPCDRIFVSNSTIYVLGNNNYSDVIQIFTAPF